MNASFLVHMAFREAATAVRESVMLQIGRDWTKPSAFYGIVNLRCNSRCQFCEDWRLKEYPQDLSREQWMAALMSVRDFVGSYQINFSGGEPLLRRDMTGILEDCHSNGIEAGITTNGTLFTPPTVERLIAARPFNVNISVDGPDAALHDSLRGRPGFFDRISAGIQRLLAARQAAHQRFPVIIKTIILSANLRRLPELVQWAAATGATAVNFQPLERWTPETHAGLWINEPQWPELRQVMRELIRMKLSGAPVLNSVEMLDQVERHFREESACAVELPCRIGLRNYFIRPDGNVELCGGFPAIGNVTRQSAREIWYSDKAREVREQTMACTRLCLATCKSRKSASDKLRAAFILLRNGKVS